MTLINHERAAQVLAAANIDVVIATRHDNVRYLTDLPFDLAAALGLPLAAVLRRRGLELTALVAPRGMAGLIGPQVAGTTQVYLYGEFHAMREADVVLGPEEEVACSLLDTAPGEGKSFDVVLRSVVEGIGSGSRVAWDAQSIGDIAADLGWTASADGDALLREIRQVKTPIELRRLRAAAAVAEGVELELMAAARPGADWAAVARSVPQRVAVRGGSFGFFSGGAGWQGGFIYRSQVMPLKLGDVVRLDLGVSVDGYWSDTGRTMSLGSPILKAERTYRALRTGMEACLEAVRAGTTFGKLYDVAMKNVQRGLPGYRRHHTGHAIGLRAYDGPLVAPLDATVLEPGMVLNVEVPYYEIGWGGLQLEETIVVEVDGFEPVTRLTRDLAVSTS